MPVSLRGNSHGQLGQRKSNVRMGGGSSQVEQVVLTPDAARDPLAMATPFRRILYVVLTETFMVACPWDFRRLAIHSSPNSVQLAWSSVHLTDLRLKFEL